MGETKDKLPTADRRGPSYTERRAGRPNVHIVVETLGKPKKIVLSDLPI